MNKYLLRIVSLLLVLALIADPVTAAVASPAVWRAEYTPAPTVFTEQAFVERLINFVDLFRRKSQVKTTSFGLLRRSKYYARYYHHKHHPGYEDMFVDITDNEDPAFDILASENPYRRYHVMPPLLKVDTLGGSATRAPEIRRQIKLDPERVRAIVMKTTNREEACARLWLELGWNVTPDLLSAYMSKHKIWAPWSTQAAPPAKWVRAMLPFTTSARDATKFFKKLWGWDILPNSLSAWMSKNKTRAPWSKSAPSAEQVKAVIKKARNPEHAVALLDKKLNWKTTVKNLYVFLYRKGIRTPWPKKTKIYSAASLLILIGLSAYALGLFSGTGTAATILTAAALPFLGIPIRIQELTDMSDTISGSGATPEQSNTSELFIRQADQGFIGDREHYLQNADNGTLPELITDKMHSFNWPVDMTDSRFHLTTLLGENNYSDSKDKSQSHLGVDMQGPVLTDVHVVDDGEVVFTEQTSPHSKFGHLIDVFVYSRKSNILWIYVHLDAESVRTEVRDQYYWRTEGGPRIQAGDVIGKIGRWPSLLKEGVQVPDDVARIHGREYNHLHLEAHFVPPEDSDMPMLGGAADRNTLNPLLLFKRLYSPSTAPSQELTPMTVRIPDLSRIREHRTPEIKFQLAFKGHHFPRQHFAPEDPNLLEKLGLSKGDRVFVFNGFAGTWAQALADSGADVTYSDFDPSVVDQVQRHYTALSTSRPITDYYVIDALDMPQSQWAFSFEPLPLQENNELIWVLQRGLRNEKGVLLVFRARYPGVEKVLDLLGRTYRFPGHDFQVTQVVEGRGSGEDEVSPTHLHVIHLTPTPEIRVEAETDVAVLDALQEFTGGSLQDLLHTVAEKGIQLDQAHLEESLHRIDQLTQMVPMELQRTVQLSPATARESIVRSPHWEEIVEFVAAVDAALHKLDLCIRDAALFDVEGMKDLDSVSEVRIRFIMKGLLIPAVYQTIFDLWNLPFRIIPFVFSYSDIELLHPVIPRKAILLKQLREALGSGADNAIRIPLNHPSMGHGSKILLDPSRNIQIDRELWNHIIDFASQADLVLRQHGLIPRDAFLFGSLVTGEWEPGGDIDVGFIVSGNPTPELYRIVEALWKHPIPLQIALDSHTYLEYLSPENPKPDLFEELRQKIGSAAPDAIPIPLPTRSSSLTGSDSSAAPAPDVTAMLGAHLVGLFRLNPLLEIIPQLIALSERNDLGLQHILFADYHHINPRRSRQLEQAAEILSLTYGLGSLDPNQIQIVRGGSVISKHPWYALVFAEPENNRIVVSEQFLIWLENYTETPEQTLRYLVQVLGHEKLRLMGASHADAQSMFPLTQELERVLVASYRDGQTFKAAHLPRLLRRGADQVISDPLNPNSPPLTIPVERDVRSVHWVVLDQSLQKVTAKTGAIVTFSHKDDPSPSRLVDKLRQEIPTLENRPLTVLVRGQDVDQNTYKIQPQDMLQVVYQPAVSTGLDGIGPTEKNNQYRHHPRIGNKQDDVPAVPDQRNKIGRMPRAVSIKVNPKMPGRVGKYEFIYGVDAQWPEDEIASARAHGREPILLANFAWTRGLPDEVATAAHEFSREFEETRFDGPLPHATTLSVAMAITSLPLEGLRVLDVGAGDGALSVLMAKKGAHVTAIDFKRYRVLEEYNARANGVDNTIHFISGDAGELDPVVTGPMDVLVLNLPSSRLNTLVPDILNKYPALKYVVIGGDYWMGQLNDAEGNPYGEYYQGHDLESQSLGPKGFYRVSRYVARLWNYNRWTSMVYRKASSEIPVVKPKDPFETIKSRLSPHVIAGYEQISARLAEILEARLPRGGLVAIDGMAGGGKTTLAWFLQDALTTFYHRHATSIAGDAAINRQRSDYVSAIVEGRVEADTVRDHLSRFCRIDLLDSVLDGISRFVGSEGPAEDRAVFEIQDGFVRDDQYELVRWVFERSSLALFPFSFALLMPTLRLAGRPIVRLRILVNVPEAEERFGQRDEDPANVSGIERKQIYHKRAPQKVQPLYEQETASHVDFYIDLRGNPDIWNIQPAGASPMPVASVSARRPEDAAAPGKSVTIPRAAELMNVSIVTIYRRIREKALQTISPSGRSKRVLVESMYLSELEQTVSIQEAMRLLDASRQVIDRRVYKETLRGIRLPWGEPRVFKDSLSLPDFERSVSIQKAMELLDISRQTIYVRIKAGTLKRIYMPWGEPRILKESLPNESPAAPKRKNLKLGSFVGFLMGSLLSLHVLHATSATNRLSTAA